jgi:hypothetical protein
MLRLDAIPQDTPWYLRVAYIVRPSALVEVSTTEMARIYGPDSTTGVRIIDTSPSANLTEFGAYLDIVRGSEPYDLLYLDRLSADTFAAPVFNFQATTPIDVADIPSLSSPLHPGAEPAYLVQRDQTPFPNIPHTLWPALVRLTVARAFEAVRDPGTQQMRESGLAALQRALSIMKPRDARNTRRIVGRSPIRSIASGWSRGGRRWGVP